MIDLAKPAVIADANVVALLENALRDAKAGRLIGVGIVVVMGTGMPAINVAGTGVVEMNTGCDILKAQLMGHMLKPSKIMRAS